uniref:LysM domain-containing protein n=2 Tax=Timema TaxID=61471 RepID=A0A7R9I8W3_9NEOP|nr:unnamed protein product [Timema tahoe]
MEQLLVCDYSIPEKFMPTADFDLPCQPSTELEIFTLSSCAICFRKEMADGITEERKSIRDSAKSLKKYGSTCNHFKRQDHIKHFIMEGDTLQGIALKYGVTMEQVRRENLLWASDSLFLRESLLIPVSKDCTITSANDKFINSSELSTPVSPDSRDLSERSINDFLVEIDTSIANTKSQVKKSQGFSEFANNEDTNFVRKPLVSRLRQQQQQQLHQSLPPTTNTTNNDILSMPQPVVMTQGRKVRSSLQRLEKEQDEIFEL